MTTYEWITALFPRPGYFVEAGAHDGVGDSQTKALEDIGWTGICVEPSDAFVGLKASRLCNVDNRCLWRYDNHQVPFRQVPGDGIELSGIETCFCDHWDRSAGTTMMKPTVSLPTLLREHGAPPAIEFLALDTEGSEYEILCGNEWPGGCFDQAVGRFLAITVEHNGVTKQRDLVRSLLGCFGYWVDQQSEIEDWFVHKSIRKDAADAVGD